MRISQRKLARAILMALAGEGITKFSPTAFYDDDMNVMEEIAIKIGAEKEPLGKLQRRVRAVCRKLAQYGVLTTRMESTQKDYFGEPARQQNYWLAGSYAMRLRPDLYPHYRPEYSPEFELRYLLDCVYGDG